MMEYFQNDEYGVQLLNGVQSRAFYGEIYIFKKKRIPNVAHSKTNTNTERFFMPEGDKKALNRE